VLVALGTLDFRQRHVKEAEAAFKRAAELDPKLSAAHSALGAVYQAQNDLPKAEQEYKKALNSRRPDPSAGCSMRCSRSKPGRWTPANACWRK